MSSHGRLPSRDRIVNISRFSILRPVFTMMVILIVMILGGVSLTRLPIDLMPDITYPTISIQTRYENAGPEEVEELISRPIEQAMVAVPGVEEVSSTSSEGLSNVRVLFTWGTDLNEASNDIRDRLDRVIGRLPDDADRPMLRKFDLAGFPIMIMGASSSMDPLQLRRLIEDQIAYRIERVPGVASLTVWGGLSREVWVQIEPERLRALGLPLERVVSAIRAANVTLPAGTVQRGDHDVIVRTPGTFGDLDALRETVIEKRSDAPVRLRDVAAVTDRWERVRRRVRVNTEPGMMVAVYKQSDVNTVDVARRVHREIERVNADFPYLTLTPVMDASDFIQRAIRNVGSTAVFGGLFAVIVLLIFLGNIRSTLIIATAIPVSIIATFSLIYFAGFTLNLMTLGGLALGVGMLVDNAIVVLENIYRHREDGAGRRDAAMRGSGEVTAAIIASTLTTLVVFLPMVFVRGMAGIMFQQLAYVVSFALLASLLVALTLVPMLCGRYLRIGGAGRTRRVPAFSDRGFKVLETQYERLLERALRHRMRVLLPVLLLFMFSVAIAPRIGREFMPATDEGEIRVNVEAEPGARLEILDRAFQRIEAVTLDHVPERESMIANFGGVSHRGGGAHTGMLRLSLVPLAERERSSEAIAADLRRRLAQVPGVTVRVRTAQGMGTRGMGGMGGDERLQVEIRGYDFATADALAERIMAAIEPVGGITDVLLSREAGAPEMMIRVDRLRAADLGVSVHDVARALQTMVGGVGSGFYRERGEEVPIRVMVRDAEFMTTDELLDLTLVNAAGDRVALRNVVTLEDGLGPVQIERKDQERIVRLSANIADRDLSSIVADVREVLRDIPIPEGFAVTLGGDYEDQREAFRELVLALILALILVYMVMASLYESLRGPLVVMFSIPLAAIGVIWILLVTGTTFNVQSFVGCIMLGGIVVNNAIILVDHINLLRRRDGMALRVAVREGARRRLRPILMTAMTTMCALIPMALGMGEGGEAQAPLARVVVGGLASASLITLLVVPVMYSLIAPRVTK